MAVASDWLLESLQCLNMVPELVAWALTERLHDWRTSAYVAPALAALMESMWTGKASHVSPSKFLKKVRDRLMLRWLAL